MDKNKDCMFRSVIIPKDMEIIEHVIAQEMPIIAGDLEMIEILSDGF